MGVILRRLVGSSTGVLSVLWLVGCSDAGTKALSGNGGTSGNGAAGASGAGAGGGDSPVTGGSGGVVLANGGNGTGAGPTSATGGATSAGGQPGAGGVVSSAGSPGNGGQLMGSGGDRPGAGGISGAGGSAAGGSSGNGSGGAMPSCSSSATLVAGETTRTLQVGGVSRSYVLHVPAKYSGKTPAPLVVDFHPNLENAAFERLNSGYLALSDQNGFVIAYPQGIDNSWNVGACCTTSRTVDDLGFAKALVNDVEGSGCIDTKRVYATGYSMGGGMSLYLACNAADVFATVAAAAYDLYTDAQEPCHPSRPITVLTFRGTADPIESYAGGDSMPPNGLPVVIHRLGAVGTFQRWATLDGCTDASPAMGAGGCQTDSQCTAGVEVTLCTAPGGGHVTGDAQTGWTMMQKHPLP